MDKDCKAIKVRLYPNQEHESLFSNLFGQCRFLYNNCLEYKQTQYKLGNNIGLNELSVRFHAELLDQYKFFNMFNTNIVKNSIRDLISAYNKFYKKETKLPTFKNKYSKQTAKFNKPTAISRTNLDNGKINLTKNLKNIKFKTSKRDLNFLLNHKKEIQSITVSKATTGKYYAAILFRTKDKIKTLPNPTNKSVGIDVGINTFVMCSDGTAYDNIHSYKNIQKQIQFYQNSLSKKQKGSKNYNKLKQKIALLFEHARNFKLNYIHNITTKIVRENQTISIEDLNVSGMLKNHCLAKAIQELSLYEFRRQLVYKSKLYGRNLIIINRFFPSSKKCSNCGAVKDILLLSDRLFECPHCGHTENRDKNAAINIDCEGNRIQGGGHPLKHSLH